MKNYKKIMVISMLASLALGAGGCGAVEKEEPNVPTKYIEKADDAVEEYNKNVENINETGDSIEDDEQ